MHPDTMYELAKLKIAEDHAYAARQRLAREAQRSATFAGHGEPSLLERVADALRRTARPSTGSSDRIAPAAG